MTTRIAFVIALFFFVCLSNVSAVLFPVVPSLRIRGGGGASVTKTPVLQEQKQKANTKQLLTKLIERQDLTAEETERVWTDMLTGRLIILVLESSIYIHTYIHSWMSMTLFYRIELEICCLINYIHCTTHTTLCTIII